MERGEPPAAVARRVEGEERERAAAARTPDTAPAPRAPQITEKIEGLRARISQFRARAIDLHAKLVELEAQGDGDPDVRALRAAMMASVVRIESVVRALVEAPAPRSPPPSRFPSGTRVRR